MTIDDLELSVRTGNVLRAAGYIELDRFLGLTKAEVLALPNAGARTWKEIEELQRYLGQPRNRASEINQEVRRLNDEVKQMGLSFITTDGSIHLARIYR